MITAVFPFGQIRVATQTRSLRVNTLTLTPCVVGILEARLRREMSE